MRTLLLLLLTVCSCYGQAFTLRDPALVGQQAPAAAVGCNTVDVGPPTGTFDAQNTLFGNDATTTGVFWGLTNVTAGTICKCDLALATNGAPANNVTVSVWFYGSSPSNLLYKIGGNSDPINANQFLGSTGGKTNTFNWSANNPVLQPGTNTYSLGVFVDTPSGDATKVFALPLYNPVALDCGAVGSTNTAGQRINRRPYMKLYRQ